MAELTVDDLAQFTDDRLDSTSDETERILDAAHALVRRYCGWHVCPARLNQTVTVDGPDSPLLVLPTLKLNDLDSVTEEGLALDVDDDLLWSSNGLVRKVSGSYWSDEYQGITVVMDHGFTEAEAADWRGAVLAVADRMSLAVGWMSAAGSITAGPFSLGLRGSAGGFAAVLAPEIVAVVDNYKLPVVA